MRDNLVGMAEEGEAWLHPVGELLAAIVTAYRQSVHLRVGSLHIFHPGRCSTVAFAL